MYKYGTINHFDGFQRFFFSRNLLRSHRNNKYVTLESQKLLPTSEGLAKFYVRLLSYVATRVNDEIDNDIGLCIASLWTKLYRKWSRYRRGVLSTEINFLMKLLQVFKIITPKSDTISRDRDSIWFCMNNFERMINVGIECSLNISRNVLTLVKVDEAAGKEETSKRIRSCVYVRNQAAGSKEAF